MADSIIGSMVDAGRSDPTSASKIYSPSEIANAKLDVPKLSYTEGGLAFMGNNADSAINAVNTQALWNREDLLRKEAYQHDAHELDRIVEAAKRNGINPVFLLDALNSSNSASYSTSAAKTNSYDTNAKTDAANSAKVVDSLIAALAVIAAALV